MNLIELQKAILSEAQSKDFSLEEIESLIIKHKTHLLGERFIELCTIAGKCCDVSLERVLSKSRKAPIVRARRLVMNYYKKRGYTLDESGKKFGHDHSGAYAAITKLHIDISNDHQPTIIAHEKFNKLTENT